MKTWIYLVILTGLMLFLSMAGISEAGTNELKSLIGYGEGQNNTVSNVTISASTLQDYLFKNDSSGSGYTGLIAQLLGTTAIAVGLYISTKDINMLLVPFIVLVAIKWIITLAGIMTYAISHGDAFITPLVVLIFLPLTIGFIVSLIEFVRGTD